ncbi:MAG: SHOCT domain-containing protein [Desulfobulbaceae bacterium]|nr:SHOCT domain-containing protein [Desulfobulbaceae bacterium]
MWNCNWGLPFHYGFVGMLFNIAVLAVIVYIVVLAVRALMAKDNSKRDADDSLEIIKRKLAHGEISEEEYRRMKEILTG